MRIIFRYGILLVCGFTIIRGHAQTSQIRFEKLDSRDGMSHDRVTAIYKDQLGYMWFGTLSGLDRYDGTQVENIQPDENDPHSLTNPYIVWLKEGPGRHLWIKTTFGVFAYDVFRERFVNIRGLLEDLQIDNYNLSDIVKDDLGNYWFVIDEIGVKKYLAGQDTIYHYGGAYRDVTSVQYDGKGVMAILHKDGEIELVNLKDVRETNFLNYPARLHNIPGLKAFIDRDGNYWFYSLISPFGVCYFNPESGKIRILGTNELGSDLVSGIIQDELGHVVIAADHGGLTQITMGKNGTWNIQSFKNIPSDPRSLSHNSIISIYQDGIGLVWIGTNKGGVNYYSPKSGSFSFYTQNDEVDAVANDILPLVQADEETLWVGTDGGGLAKFDLNTGTFDFYRHQPNDPYSISSNIVVSMCHAADGGLWIGTYLGGLNHFDGKKFTRYNKVPGNPNALSDNSIWKLYSDSKDRLWVGTLKHGVDVYTPSFEKVYHFSLDSQTLHSNYVTSFCEDQNGKIWIGTGYGLEVFDPETGQIEYICKEEGNNKSLSNNSVLDVYCDRDNNLWISTMYGLNKYDYASKTFQSYFQKDGLPENIISSVLQDSNGDIWIATYKGLSRLSFENGQEAFENFDTSDGLQGDMFNERSAIRLSNGQLAFGGKNGLNIFNPDDIKTIEVENKLVFKDFYVSNHLIKPGELFNGRTWLENGINEVEQITLEPDENSFTIGFVSLNFYHKENTMFRYRLVGFDKDWVVRPNIQRVNYTNLDPGMYRFEVMVNDRNHKWVKKARTLDIEILTPFWKTPIANLLYTALVLVALLLTRRAIIQKERFRAKVNQDKLEATRLHELDLMKIKFFTNISHEFRTPLTLILTPIERLLSTVEDPIIKKNYQMIHRNARRLLTLVNQLLDFRKMEANQHRLSVATGDLINFVKNITESFSDLSTDKFIRLDFHSDVSEFLTRFDRDKVEKIMFNLLSNAFKFTNAGGRVEVFISDIAAKEDIHTIRICVRDTGIGIPDDRLGDIFNRFFQVDREDRTSLNHGSGIGLSITREFVEMHEGNIRAESKLDEGSTFIVELPLPKLSEKHLNQDVNADLRADQSDDAPFEAGKPSILLVDDNADFRFYLKDNLKEHYNIIEASTGKVAWKKLMGITPDLIVTDIMMPEMNGVDLCKKVKSDPRTAHVPVILLTAHYSDDQKLDGFEAGAIEYITKPFNFEILERAIHSAVQLQKFIHESEHRIEVKPSDIAITSLDEQFIQRAMSFVEENISNADFSVQELSREMAVSRGQLYKKTLELTGVTPIEFIRSIRIKRAAALLSKSQLNVAEVAYKVGFNNPKYFTKYFKQEFGVLPSRYASQVQQNKAG